VLRRYPAAGFRVAAILGTLAIVAARCLGDPTTVPFYRPVAIGLGLWAACAAACEWLGIRRLSLRQAGIAFVVTDAAFVTALLVMVGGADSPLVAAHPVLVSATGLWLDRRLVRIAAAAALAGYAILLATDPAAFRWNVAAIVTVLVVSAAAIADFQVGRLRRG
jgi:hypothetical protein